MLVNGSDECFFWGNTAFSHDFCVFVPHPILDSFQKSWIESMAAGDYSSQLTQLSYPQVPQVPQVISPVAPALPARFSRSFSWTWLVQVTGCRSDARRPWRTIMTSSIIYIILYIYTCLYNYNIYYILYIIYYILYKLYTYIHIYDVMCNIDWYGS
jgi:hypothetical protein